jgi:cob(I)alamin adenosyltransferase
VVAGASPKRRRAQIEASAVATGRGDDGTTGLLYGGRIDKDDPRVDAYGTIDEAVAALGLVRAELGVLAESGDLPDRMADQPELILQIQRQLFVAGSELAANADAWDRLVDDVTQVSESMLIGIEEVLARKEAAIEMPREFIVPGETRVSAGLEHARTVIRRAERRVVTLDRAGQVPGRWLVAWLNRVADLLWVLARVAEQAEGGHATRARTGRRTAPRAASG